MERKEPEKGSERKDELRSLYREEEGKGKREKERGAWNINITSLFQHRGERSQVSGKVRLQYTSFSYVLMFLCFTLYAALARKTDKTLLPLTNNYFGTF